MEKLSKRVLNKRLNALGIINKSFRLSFYKKLTSTFNVANNGIVVAAFQSGGMGRLERCFCSPKGGIYLSILHKIVPLATIKAAVGVMTALEQEGFCPKVKWVNDIFIDKMASDTQSGGGENQKNKDMQAINMQKEGKVCGILAKQTGGLAGIGIGINYAPKELPVSTAARMYSSTKGINNFAVLLIKSVKESLKLCDKDALDFYTKRLRGRGEEAVLPNGKRGVILGVNLSGELLCMQDNSEATFSYGDIL